MEPSASVSSAAGGLLSRNEDRWSLDPGCHAKTTTIGVCLTCNISIQSSSYYPNTPTSRSILGVNSPLKTVDLSVDDARNATDLTSSEIART
jgi:hypothetical protein